MGMFDWVEFEMRCPNCDTVLNEFQSKDADCVMATLPPEAVNHFHGSCHNCRTWFDIKRIVRKPAFKVMAGWGPDSRFSVLLDEEGRKVASYDYD